MTMFYNPLVVRAQRMADGERRRRIEGTRLHVMDAITCIAKGRLTFEEREYAMYLCGQRDKEQHILSPVEKARVGRLFQRACAKRRSWITRLSVRDQYEALPGITAVPRNRILVRKIQSENGKRKRG